MKVCLRCRFRIPEDEFRIFKACGQCGGNRHEEVKEDRDEERERNVRLPRDEAECSTK